MWYIFTKWPTTLFLCLIELSKRTSYMSVCCCFYSISAPVWLFYAGVNLIIEVASGPVDRGSIPGRVRQKTKKWYLMSPCLTLSIIRYGSRVKRSNPGNGEVPSSTHQCSSYWKGSVRVILDKGCQLYSLLYIHIYRIEINMHLTIAWTAIDRLLITWEAHLSDKTKQFLQEVVVLI